MGNALGARARRDSMLQPWRRLAATVQSTLHFADLDIDPLLASISIAIANAMDQARVHHDLDAAAVLLENAFFHPDAFFRRATHRLADATARAAEADAILHICAPPLGMALTDWQPLRDTGLWHVMEARRWAASGAAFAAAARDAFRLADEIPDADGEMSRRGYWFAVALGQLLGAATTITAARASAQGLTNAAAQGSALVTQLLHL